MGRGQRRTFDPKNDIPDLSGKVILVTGGTSGLGFETVRQCAMHHPARVYMAGRSKQKCRDMIKSIEDELGFAVPVVPLQLDLSSFDSIKSAVQQFETSESRLDLLINNAAIMMTPKGTTAEGYEVQFGTNYMGHALLTQLLLPVLLKTAKETAGTRVVMVSSDMERMVPRDTYPVDELKTPMQRRSTMRRYALSKLGLMHHTTQLAQLLQKENIKIVGVKPGIVATNLHQNASCIALKILLTVFGWFAAAPTETGVLNQLWASFSPDAKSGEIYAPVGVPNAGSKLSRDPEMQAQLWKWTQAELHKHSQSISNPSPNNSPLLQAVKRTAYDQKG